MKKTVAIFILLLLLILSSCKSEPSVKENDDASDTPMVNDVSQENDDSDSKDDDRKNDQKEENEENTDKNDDGKQEENPIIPGHKQNQPIKLPTDEF